jgi:CTP synthase (UTP-ammonia lyase)
MLAHMMTTSVAIIGDFKAANQSHAATNSALVHSSAAMGVPVEGGWVGTEELEQAAGLARLAEFAGVWIGPASPYKSMVGALSAIRWARENQVPLLGTCGGFQHIIIEYARNVLGFKDAEHEETSPEASRLFISRLACSLVGRTMVISLQPDSLVARAYGHTQVQEGYYCNFGVNPEFVDVLRASPLRIVGSDAEGLVRAVELAEHPFFVGTLFLPQFNSTPTAPHPLISAWLRAVCGATQPAA